MVYQKVGEIWALKCRLQVANNTRWCRDPIGNVLSHGKDIAVTNETDFIVRFTGSNGLELFED